MQEIRFNPFRYLGIFTNATMKEQSAQDSQMKAYARVGQKVDNPLRLHCLLGPLPDDEKAIADSESLIAFPIEREQHTLFWFAHDPNSEENLQAVELLDKGWSLQAMAIWMRNPTKWFDKAYEVAVDEETKEFIAGLAVTIYQEGFETLPPEVDRSKIPPLGAYNGPIPELREYAKTKY